MYRAKSPSLPLSPGPKVWQWASPREEEVRGLWSVLQEFPSQLWSQEKHHRGKLTGQSRSVRQVPSKLDTNALGEQPAYFQILERDNHGCLHGWGGIWPVIDVWGVHARLERNIWKKKKKCHRGCIFSPRVFPEAVPSCWSTRPFPSTQPISVYPFNPSWSVPSLRKPFSVSHT